MYVRCKVPSNRIFSYAQNGARLPPTVSVYRGNASSGSSLWGDTYTRNVAESGLPAIRSPGDEERVLRPLRTPLSDGEKVENMEDDSDCCEERMETDEENDDKDDILKGEMLGDRDIMKAQSLLKIQFPGMDGLLPPTPIAKGLVQIINTMELHWVCLSPRNEHNNCIKVAKTFNHNVIKQ